jgi:methionyl-tRNA formyltransferase
VRFAITCVDRYLGVFESFLNAGWEPVRVFTVPVDNRLDHNKAVIARAESLKVPVQISRMRQSDLEDLARLGCDALIVASYNWRIGDWTSKLQYAVNFHPSPLPIGRGPHPLVRAILEGADSWGVACHKIEHEFDTGDILAERQVPMSADECRESLDIKIQLATKSMAHDVATRFPALWQGARPQGEGSYWKAWNDADRTIDFGQPVATIMRVLRAFGLIESLARVNDVPIHVRRAAGWTEAHSYRPGALIHADNRTLVVAARDGFIALIEWSLASLGAIAEFGRPSDI